VGRIATFFGLDLTAPAVDPDTVPTNFSGADELIGGADIDPAVFGLESYATSTSPAPRMDRRSAIQVPAVKRARDLIAGTLGGLPLDLYNSAREHVDPSPFTQPERNVPRSVTMARTFDDMLFEGIAWWKVTERDRRDYPTYFKRLRPGRVTVDDDRDKVMIDGKEVDHRELIRFDSPTEGLLLAGARAIRTCLALDAYAANAAQGIPPLDYFVPADDTDPFAGGNDDDEDDDDEIKTFLAEWAEARRTRTTAYIPASVRYMVAGFDPKNLQMAEQRDHAVLEIARVAGIDPEELGVSTTSRTYSNTFDRRKAFLDFTLGGYMIAVEDRLKMGDVTPGGQYVKFNLDAFLRSDPASRYAAYAAGKAVGALDDDDIARLEDRPAGTVRTPATVTALPTRTQESA
jgi:HK97 family phage portal protein